MMHAPQLQVLLDLVYSGFQPKMNYHFPWSFPGFPNNEIQFSRVYLYIWPYRRIYALTLPFKCDLYLLNISKSKNKILL